MDIISFVIPCYRSEKTVAAVIDEIKSKVKERAEIDYQIIAVNDGSPDGVWEVISSIAKNDKQIVAVNLNKNYGQANAQMAGLKFAVGDITVFLDDDGQCPIDKLWDLIAPIKSGECDMTFAKYPQKKQNLFKNFGSRVNNFTTHALLDMPKNCEASNFFAMNKLLAQNIIKYKNPYPFMTGIVCNITKRIINVPMEERNRISGATGYTFTKLLHLWLNGFTNFSVVPLRAADAFGSICASVGFVFGMISIIRKILNPNILLGYTSIMSMLLFIGGIIMLLLGIIGEYIGRIFICINNTPQYVIKETINEEYE